MLRLVPPDHLLTGNEVWCDETRVVGLQRVGLDAGRPELNELTVGVVNLDFSW